MSEDWSARRREAAQAHGEHLAAAKARDTAAAAAQVADFVERARAAGIPTEQLRARDYSGRGPYRTSTRGWYIRANRTVAIGEDGKFYLLITDGGLKARLLGADLTPSDPPLILGAGGRDGESISLREALARVAPES